MLNLDSILTNNSKNTNNNNYNNNKKKNQVDLISPRNAPFIPKRNNIHSGNTSIVYKLKSKHFYRYCLASDNQQYALGDYVIVEADRGKLLIFNL